jgi:carbamate kinase
MSASAKLAVVAIGGNSLIRDQDHQSIPDQYETVTVTVRQISDMIEAGWNVIVTHGNGPQMGFILRRSELAIHELPPVPMDYAGADLQGSIGYMFVKAFHNEFRRRGLRREPVAVVTEILVDRNDPRSASQASLLDHTWTKPRPRHWRRPRGGASRKMPDAAGGALSPPRCRGRSSILRPSISLPAPVLL